MRMLLWKVCVHVMLLVVSRVVDYFHDAQFFVVSSVCKHKGSSVRCECCEGERNHV